MQRRGTDGNVTEMKHDVAQHAPEKLHAISEVLLPPTMPEPTASSGN
jgi:hypothetical protein